MIQTTLFQTTNPALEAAKDMIRVYVLRGDTLESLRAGQQGSYGKYHASIGGYTESGKKVTPYFIIVHKDMNGEPCEQIFELEKLYNEIKEEDVRENN